jgi:hypothetical protein
LTFVRSSCGFFVFGLLGFIEAELGAEFCQGFLDAGGGGADGLLHDDGVEAGAGEQGFQFSAGDFLEIFERGENGGEGFGEFFFDAIAGVQGGDGEGVGAFLFDDILLRGEGALGVQVEVFEPGDLGDFAVGTAEYFAEERFGGFEHGQDVDAVGGFKGAGCEAVFADVFLHDDGDVKEALEVFHAGALGRQAAALGGGELILIPGAHAAQGGGHGPAAAARGRYPRRGRRGAGIELAGAPAEGGVIEARIGRELGRGGPGGVEGFNAAGKWKQVGWGAG